MYIPTKKGSNAIYGANVRSNMRNRIIFTVLGKID